MRWEELGEQPCSMSRTLAVVGDRWTLLILSDCFLGVRRFDAFERRIGLTRHLLADRLKKLVEHEVLAKVPYQQRPLREEYRLTEKGMALHSVILSLVSWGDTWMADERGGHPRRREELSLPRKDDEQMVEETPQVRACARSVSAEEATQAHMSDRQEV